MTELSRGRAYVDSNIFIYAVEGITTTAGPARKLIASLRSRKGMMVTSEITLAEVLAPTSRSGTWSLRKIRPVYLDLLVWSDAVELVPVTREILIGTAEVRSNKKLKLPDAIHVASAIRSACDYFVSGDADYNWLPSGMRRIGTDNDGIESLLRALK